MFESDDYKIKVNLGESWSKGIVQYQQESDCIQFSMAIRNNGDTRCVLSFSDVPFIDNQLDISVSTGSLIHQESHRITKGISKIPNISIPAKTSAGITATFKRIEESFAIFGDSLTFGSDRFSCLIDDLKIKKLNEKFDEIEDNGVLYKQRQATFWSQKYDHKIKKQLRR